MDVSKLIQDLKRAQENLNLFKVEQKKYIRQEAECLVSIAKHLFSFASKKLNNGEDALLIYSFPSDEKTFISPDVYIRADGMITYQVYNEVAYRGYRPDAKIEHGYVMMPLDEFLQFVSLQKIYQFLESRVEELYEVAQDINESNKERATFIQKFKSVLS